jgi:hypothetical protein
MDEAGLPPGPIESPVRRGGTQNILLRFDRGGRPYVLRRPPLHKREKSDETMRREARVLGALRGSGVPHPELIAACAGTDILGASSYLMKPVRGFNPTMGLPALHASDPKVRRRMGLALAEGIAALGAVDHEAAGPCRCGRWLGVPVSPPQLPTGTFHPERPCWPRSRKRDSGCWARSCSGPSQPTMSRGGVSARRESRTCCSLPRTRLATRPCSARSCPTAGPIPRSRQRRRILGDCSWAQSESCSKPGG